MSIPVHAPPEIQEAFRDVWAVLGPFKETRPLDWTGRRLSNVGDATADHDVPTKSQVDAWIAALRAELLAATATPGGGALAETVIAGNLVPDITATRDIGTSTKTWRNAWLTGLTITQTSSSFTMTGTDGSWTSLSTNDDPWLLSSTHASGGYLTIRKPTAGDLKLGTYLAVMGSGANTDHILYSDATLYLNGASGVFIVPAVTFGSGSVALIGSDGRVNGPLSSTIIDDLSGANLTTLNASNISSGTLDAARLPTAAVTSTASKETGGAPYTNDGRIAATINGVSVNLMTTA
jgi:hypothetical protein